MTKPAGIYKLQSGPFFYLGSSANLPQRKRDHQWRLRKGIHPCLRLQAEFNQSGEASFTPISFLKKSKLESAPDFRIRLRAIEQAAIDEHADHPQLENTSLNSRSNGIPGGFFQKLWQDPTARKIMIDRIRASATNPSPETREKMASAKRGANNVKSRAVTVTSPTGIESVWPSTSIAAKSINVSQQLLDSWLKGTTPWPGTAKNGKTKFPHLTQFTARYS